MAKNVREKRARVKMVALESSNSVYRTLVFERQDGVQFGMPIVLTSKRSVFLLIEKIIRLFSKVNSVIYEAPCAIFSSVMMTECFYC